MATADAFRSSTTRPVGLRRRGDLVTNRQVHQGQAWWVVKDPISLSYFRFRPEEYALLDMLDAERTYRATQLAFRQVLAAYMTSVEQINFAVGKQVMQ
jgi:hypothetical protein